MRATTRLAPSPTGALHLGNARTLALTWWWARRRGARLVMRIEDLDSPRKKLAAIEEAIEDLEWLGLDWDGEPVLQSERHEQHLAALERLNQGGHLFSCTCRRKDLEEAQDAPHGPGDLVYPGTCRDRYAGPEDAWEEARRPVAIRVRAPAEPVSVQPDGFRGLTSEPCTVDDFVISRWSPDENHRIAYQLGVVVDDGLDGVTHVIRGDDLLSSVPRQKLLRAWLGLEEPDHLHLPLVVGEDGRRLAKRHGDTRLSAYREAGVPADRIRRWIGLSAGLDANWFEDPTAGSLELEATTPGPIVVPAHRVLEGPPTSA